ncbi:MAG: hypothetical protein GX171_07965 [Clostridiales bacterium]|jgi:Fur family ferric uptake transcriptional regulator|nr:hypothetical protein [Clostridiales bacterium]
MSERRDYRTRQKDAVLHCFEAQPLRAMTAQEVFDQLNEEGLSIGRTTVYRTVARLSEQGLLLALAQGPVTGPTRYQHRGGKSRSISVRCSGCGLIAGLTCAAVDDFEQHLLNDHGFSLQEDECLLPGLCATCRNTHD